MVLSNKLIKSTLDEWLYQTANNIALDVTKDIMSWLLFRELASSFRTSSVFCGNTASTIISAFSMASWLLLVTVHPFSLKEDNEVVFLLLKLKLVAEKLFELIKPFTRDVPRFPAPTIAILLFFAFI